MTTPQDRTARAEERPAGLEERMARVEGILEQINQRLGNVEGSVLTILEQKADKSEVRLLFGATLALLAAILGVLGTVLARI